MLSDRQSFLRGEAGPALLSEPALAADWNRPEEDEVWAHLGLVVLIRFPIYRKRSSALPLFLPTRVTATGSLDPLPGDE